MELDIEYYECNGCPGECCVLEVVNNIVVRARFEEEGEWVNHPYVEGKRLPKAKTKACPKLKYLKKLTVEEFTAKLL